MKKRKTSVKRHVLNLGELYDGYDRIGWPKRGGSARDSRIDSPKSSVSSKVSENMCYNGEERDTSSNGYWKDTCNDGESVWVDGNNNSDNCNDF